MVQESTARSNSHKRYSRACLSKKASYGPDVDLQELNNLKVSQLSRFHVKILMKMLQYFTTRAALCWYKMHTPRLAVVCFNVFSMCTPSYITQFFCV